MTLTLPRAIAWIAFAFGLYVAALLQSCADSHEPITGACYASFSTVLEEWEVHAPDPVPEHCQHLDEDYEVRVVPSSEFPWGSCDPLAVGCTVPGRWAIYLEEGRSQRDTVNTAVHEWIHALSECALGDLDPEHNRAGLWEHWLPEPVETRAIEKVAVGECL